MEYETVDDGDGVSVSVQWRGVIFRVLDKEISPFGGISKS